MSNMELEASDLVREIKRLNTSKTYEYVNSKTTTLVEIVDIVEPEGPIFIRRYNPHKQQGRSSGQPVSISTEMLARIAAAMSTQQPVNFDRVLGGSYNTRSALEALLAHTPQFYACRPGRIDSYSGEIEEGHKHLIWQPENPHKPGVIVWIESDITVSEVPVSATYQVLDIPHDLISGEIDIDIQRRHAQIQAALLIIGRQIGYKTWIALGDKQITYGKEKLGEMDGALLSLDKDTFLAPYHKAVQSALRIDCIWFKNSHLIPAVMEVEHSTGITSGLNRMLGLKLALPALPLSPIRYVVVAPDEDRAQAMKKCNEPQFRVLNARYFPYSAVEELYALCQRRHIRGITEEFLDCYMEPTIADNK